MIGSNLFALLGPYLSGEAIDAISSPGGVDFNAVAKYCVLMAVFYVVSAVLAYLLSILMINLSQRIVRYMRQEVFDKILSLPVGALDRVQAGDLINRISYRYCKRLALKRYSPGGYRHYIRRRRAYRHDSRLSASADGIYYHSAYFSNDNHPQKQDGSPPVQKAFG